MMPFAFAVLLTFPVSFSGSAVLEKTVGCNDLKCVHQMQDDCMASPACSRIRVWSYKDYTPLIQLMTFVTPPLFDWQKA